MKSIFKLVFALCLIGSQVLAQSPHDFSIVVVDEQQKPIENATVELRKADDKALVKAAITNNKGIADFKIALAGKYIASVSSVGHTAQLLPVFEIPSAINTVTVKLNASTKSLQEVAIIGYRPFVQKVQGKTIVNVDAAVTNVGTSVLEVLEKSPGVMVDRNGGISLQGKASVLVMIDDKPTYLSSTELTNMLSSMSSSQVNTIELITSPSAKYDASGNAGIINIKTKKNKQEGFNGNFQTNIGQGKFIKNNNSLQLNFRKGRFNTFVNYSFNYNKNFMFIYAYREYFNGAGAVTAALDQPSNLGNNGMNNMVKTGLDFYASQHTTFGLTLTGVLVSRKSEGSAVATWLSAQKAVDSAITTSSASDFRPEKWSDKCLRPLQYQQNTRPGI
jgi:iron complex outermembrane receptor protein